MSYTCKVERVTAGGHDEVTLVWSPGSRTTVYIGVCRVWEIQGASQVSIGEEEYMLSSVQASFPWDAPLFLKDDEIIILTSPYDDVLVNSRYQIQSSARAGDLRATRRYAVTALQSKR